MHLGGIKSHMLNVQSLGPITRCSRSTLIVPLSAFRSLSLMIICQMIQLRSCLSLYEIHGLSDANFLRQREIISAARQASDELLKRAGITIPNRMNVL